MAEKEDWKQLYREGLREWENSDRILRKLVSRLALAGAGASAALDAVLDEVQRNAKSGELASLELDLENLSEAIKTLDADRRKPENATPGIAQNAQVTDGADPATLSNAASHTGAHTGADTGARDYCVALLSELELPADAERSLQDFRNRIPELEEGRCLVEMAAQLGQLLQAQAIQPETTPHAVLRELMLNLIDEVEISQPGMGSLQTLRETVAKGAEEDWHRVLARVIGEIRQIINRINSDKHALAELVREVGAELSQISEALLEDRQGLQDGREGLTRLQGVMNAGVERIEAQIDEQDDIDELKAGIGATLGEIKVGLSEFIESDQQRLTDAETRNVALEEQVLSIQTEAEELRKSLESNREKLLHDTLTGAGSRLAYDEALASELSRFRRHGQSFCLALLDIDFFKRVNDTFGHSAGDKALQMVAKIVGDRVREADGVYRVGGEEFALLLPTTELDKAKTLVEALRQAVEHSEFHYDSKPVSITLSAGLTNVLQADTAVTLFDRADDALYRAKESGRNRIETR
ncbi:MAG: diguanylate cyclase [Pseudomonadota bacterium]